MPRRGNSPTGARSPRGNSVNRDQRGVRGTAGNGQSLRRQIDPNTGQLESMGAYTRRTGGMTMGNVSKS